MAFAGSEENPVQLPHGWTITDIGGPSAVRFANGGGGMTGAPPLGAGPSQKFTFSAWMDAAALAAANRNFDLGTTATSFPEFLIEMPRGLSTTMIATWDTSISGGNQHYIDLSGPFTHDTGWANLIFSIDNSIPVCSAAICYSDLGPNDDLFATGGTANNALGGTFDPTVPFSNSPLEQAWHLQTGSGVGGQKHTWVTLKIGSYYDLSVAANRRVFNTACPSGDRLAVKDTTSLSPELLMYGRKEDFVKNRIDNAIWVPFPALTSVSGVPGCPPAES